MSLAELPISNKNCIEITSEHYKLIRVDYEPSHPFGTLFCLNLLGTIGIYFDTYVDSSFYRRGEIVATVQIDKTKSAAIKLFIDLKRLEIEK